MNRTTTSPGFARQGTARTVFRVLGVVLLLAALALIVTGAADFFGATGSFEAPTKFWMLIAGLPLLAVAGWLLLAGFAGAGARYMSGEYSPVLKDTATYLTDGKGVLNVGATETASGAGPFCRTCGTRNDADARFCDSCGTSTA